MSEAGSHDPACVIRAHAGPDGRVRLHARRHGFVAEGQTGYAPEGDHPAALDYLLGALAADLAAGLLREAARAGVALDQVELSLAGHLDNPLVALGVVGESGSPRLARVRGSIYVSTELPEPQVRGIWEQALRKAPVHATLAACVDLELQLKLVP